MLLNSEFTASICNYFTEVCGDGFVTHSEVCKWFCDPDISDRKGVAAWRLGILKDAGHESLKPKGTVLDGVKSLRSLITTHTQTVSVVRASGRPWRPYPPLVSIMSDFDVGGRIGRIEKKLIIHGWAFSFAELLSPTGMLPVIAYHLSEAASSAGGIPVALELSPDPEAMFGWRLETISAPFAFVKDKILAVLVSIEAAKPDGDTKILRQLLDKFEKWCRSSHDKKYESSLSIIDYMIGTDEYISMLKKADKKVVDEYLASEKPLACLASDALWDSVDRVRVLSLVQIGDKVWHLNSEENWCLGESHIQGKIRKFSAEGKYAISSGDETIFRSREPVMLPGIAASKLRALCTGREWLERKTLASIVVVIGLSGGVRYRIRALGNCYDYDDGTVVWMDGETPSYKWEFAESGVSPAGEYFDIGPMRYGTSTEEAVSMEALTSRLSKLKSDRVKISDPARFLKVIDKLGDTSDTKEFKELYGRFGFLENTPLELKGELPVEKIRSVLDREWPWATAINAAACRQLALGRFVGKKFFFCSPLMLLGPPGTGKTRWARRIAEIAGVGFHCHNLSNGSDPYAVSGISRTWHAAGPSIVVRTMKKTMSANPLICLDEIDKAAKGREHGSAQDAVLPMLERSTASRLTDDYLSCIVDARWVSWIMTANELGGLSEPLLDRCKVLHFPPPRPSDFDCILGTALADIATQLLCLPENLPKVSAATVQELRRLHVRELSVRRLVICIEDALGYAADGQQWTLANAATADGKNKIGFSV